MGIKILLFMFFCRRNQQVSFVEKQQLKLISLQNQTLPTFACKQVYLKIHLQCLKQKIRDKELNLNKLINYLRTLGPKCLRSVLQLTLYFRCLKMWYSCESYFIYSTIKMR